MKKLEGQRESARARRVAWRMLLGALLVFALLPPIAAGPSDVEAVGEGGACVASAAELEDPSPSETPAPTEDRPPEKQPSAGDPVNDGQPVDSAGSRVQVSPEELSVPDDEVAAAVAPDVEPRATGEVLYVSASGNDLTGDGTRALPLATLGAAVQKGSSSTAFTVTVMGNLTATKAALVGAKDVTVNTDSAQSAAAVITLSTAATLFSVDAGSLTLSRVVIDGASVSADHQAVAATGANAQVTLASGATIQNWRSTGAAGAVRVNANGAAFTMQKGSSIRDCGLVAKGAQTGGAAVSILAGRTPGIATAPSASNRASFTMQDGASIVNCNTQLTENGVLSGGGAIHAADTVVDIQKGAVVDSSTLTYRNVLLLLDPTATRQGGGGLFANNCKVNIAGTIASCKMVSGVNVAANADFYAGGGGVYLYNQGCAAEMAVDCRTVVSGTISKCSAVAGGGVFYWSEADGYGEGGSLWVGASDAPLTTAGQVVDRVYDTFTLAGSVEGCGTADAGTLRTVALGSSDSFEHPGVGGGGVCGAYNGLIVLADGSRISGCATYSEGGAVSSFGTSVFCLDDPSNPSAGPSMSACTSGKIAGGLSIGASSSIENVVIDGCAAAAFGGGMYLCSGSTTMYNCSVTNCTANMHGGGIMQDANSDLFWYGGTVTGNRATLGGGGIALLGLQGGTANAPRGLVFGYPVTENAGYTNPAFYKTSILSDKIVAPSIVRANTQVTDVASDVWTNALGPSGRISVSGNLVTGSKVGVRMPDALALADARGLRFGSVFQPSADLAPFVSDTDSTLVAAANGTQLVWADGFTVDYRANAPLGSTLNGTAPFDGADGVANAYLRTTGSATVLGQGAMTVDGYAFKGWSSSPSAATAQYQPGAALGYNASLDPLANGHVVLHAVWQTPPRVCQIIRDTNGTGTPDTFFRSYATLHEAFQAAQSNDRIEMVRDAPLVDFTSANKPADGGVTLGFGITGVTLTTAPLVQPILGALGWLGSVPATGSLAATLTRTASGAASSWFSVAGGLTIANLAVDGACTARQAQDGTGIASAHALFEVAGASATLTVGAGAALRNAYNASGSGGAVHASAAASVLMVPASSIVGCSAADGGGVAVEAADFTQSGGSIASCASARFGGGVYAGPQAACALTGLAEVRDNVAKRTGGGVYVDSAAHLSMAGGSVAGNAASAENNDGGTYAGAFVGGVALGPYGGASPLATLGGASLVVGNGGRSAHGLPTDAPQASDLEASRFGASYALAVDASGLAPTASVGITSTDPTLLMADAQFASRVGAAPVSGLQLFFNDANAGLVSAAGAGDAVVWRGLHADVSFTKVGVDQSTGATVKLGGAKFNLYRYGGSIALGPLTINDGSVDAAGTLSTQWAPVIAADGTVGTAGDSSNVPYVFESSAHADTLGQVMLTQLTPASWYMLVEVDAPDGYQKPTGQWAFQAIGLSGVGGYGIDASTILARKGDGGLLPTAFSTSITIGGSVEQGVYLTNVARYNLPFAGVPAIAPYVGALLGLLLIAAAFAVRRARRTSL